MLAPSTRAGRPDRRAGARCSTAARRRVIALGPAMPGLAPEPDRRSGRRPREPVARARARALRRRPRLRAGPAEPLVPGAARLARARGRDLPLARAPRLPARPGAARAAPRVGSTRCSRPRGRRPRPRRAAAARRLPRSSPPGVDTELFRPAGRRSLVVLEWRPERAARSSAPSCARCAQLPGWELVLLRTKPLRGRPTISARALAGGRTCAPLATGRARRRC